MERVGPGPQNAVEDAYWQSISRMTGPERVRRSLALYDFIVRMIRHRLAREHPEWTEQEVRLHAAAVLYQSDAPALDLLRRAGLR